MSVLLFPLGMITSVIIQRVKIRSDKNLTEQRKRATQLWEVFTEGILGILSIVLNKNRQIYEDKVKFSIDDLQKVQLQQAKLENVSGFMTRSLFMTTIGIILLFSSILVNRNQISVGELTAVLMYNHMLTDPLLNLLQVNQKISILRASIRRLDEIYHFPKEIIEEKPVSVDEIRLTNISYQFNQKPVFTNISLTIGHAQAIGIFGKTGSGKSTLINLIAGIYEIQEGKLEYLYKSRPVSGKPSVRYMLQDDYVFNDTLAKNIRIGNSDLTVQEIETLIDICQLRELYTKSKTEKVGINGSRLSGGERKRLLIARTLASLEYDIYIFDEMSSGLDRNTFLTIYSKIEEILASKIRIYVEHNEEIKKILPRWYELKTEKQP